MPKTDREDDEPIDIGKEAFVNHRGVFLDIGQFAVYVQKMLKPKGLPLPIVQGWANRSFVPDAGGEEQIAKEFIAFARSQWQDFGRKSTHHDGSFAGDSVDDVKMPPVSVCPEGGSQHPNPLQEQYEPNRPEKKECTLSGGTPPGRVGLSGLSRSCWMVWRIPLPVGCWLVSYKYKHKNI